LGDRGILPTSSPPVRDPPPSARFGRRSVTSKPCRLSPSIEALRDADRQQAIAVLARAFCDNPLNVAVIGSGDPQRRLRSNLHGMRSLLPVAARHGNILAARIGSRVTGVLISASPDAYPLPAPPVLQRLRCLLGQGWGVASRWGRVYEALQAHHPLDPSWYLGTLGVDPTLHGRGVGSALLARWLERVDRERSAAYLETDVFANVGFYARSGFELVGEVEVLGIPIWRMWRPAPSGEMSTELMPE
jgi:GNAT superfamily N-acetyltransferase